MFTTIRKHQRWLMLVIAVLTIIAFAFLYNTTDMDRVGMNRVANIYGREVMQVDVEKAVRNYQLAMALGQVELIRGLSGQARTEDEAMNNFIWNLMILQHEAASLGVEPGTQAVVDRLKSLPVFQKDGQFDPIKYADFVQNQLAPRGFTERQLESVIRDTLRLEGVRELVVSPAVVQPTEVEPALERLAPADVEVLRFVATDVAKDVIVSDEEVKQAFDAQQDKLKSPEKRSVRYVAFVLDGKDRELKDKDRVLALQKLSMATGEMSSALDEAGGSLVAAAKAKGLEVHTTPKFAPDASAGGALVGLDGVVIPAAARVAFRMPADAGHFEIVELEDEGYAIIEVASVDEARPLTFDEARADLRAELIEKKRDVALREAANKTATALRAAIAGGKTFEEAAKEAKVQTESKKGVSLFSEGLAPEDRQLAMAISDVKVGEVSELIPVPTGGLLAYVASREPATSPAVAERRPMLLKGAVQGKQMLLFAQWLIAAREASNLQMYHRM